MNYKSKILQSEQDGGIIPLDPEEYELFIKQGFLKINDKYSSIKDVLIYKNFFDYPYDFYENPELILTFFRKFNIWRMHTKS